MKMPQNKKSKHSDMKKNDHGDEFSKKPLKDKIGNSLKKMYDDVVDEPVPDEFLRLLAEADSKQGEI